MGFELGVGVSVDSIVQMIEFGVTTPMLVRFSASACRMILILFVAGFGAGHWLHETTNGKGSSLTVPTVASARRLATP